jgi:hypothetical protein
VSQLAVKLLLAPAFVVAVSLAVRRLGPLLGGVVGGLPVVAGPILLTFALEHGEAFAAHAAVATLLGLVSLTAFVVVYGRLAGRAHWIVCLLTGWLAFLAVTVALDSVHASSVVALLLAWATFGAALRLTDDPSLANPGASAPSPPRWDLPVRALCALALVLALTAGAAALGPHLSGLLAPFPIITSVLAAFTHAQAGAQATRRLLRGMVLGFFAFALFCFAVAVLVEPLGIAAAFLLAGAAALLAQGSLVAARIARAPRPAPAAGERAG